LAYELKMSIDQVLDMSGSEIRGWASFLKIKNEREKEAYNKARN
jgi:hypothetical protein